MRYYATLFALGLIIFFLPFLGFPPAWKNTFLFVAGFAISAITFSFIIKSRTTLNQTEKEIPHEPTVTEHI